MNGQEYLQQLEQRLAQYYDKKPLPKAPAFVLAAELNAADEGYFIIPDLKTYSVQHNEYLYAARFDKQLTAETAAPYLQFTKEAMAALKTTTEHMSSIYALLFICEAGVDDKTLADLQKLRQHKDYCFTLKGWSDLALYIVDIPAQRLYCNKAGAKEKALFEFAKA